MCRIRLVYSVMTLKVEGVTVLRFNSFCICRYYNQTQHDRTCVRSYEYGHKQRKQIANELLIIETNHYFQTKRTFIHNKCFYMVDFNALQYIILQYVCMCTSCTLKTCFVNARVLFTFCKCLLFNFCKIDCVIYVYYIQSNRLLHFKF